MLLADWKAQAGLDQKTFHAAANASYPADLVSLMAKTLDLAIQNRGSSSSSTLSSSPTLSSTLPTSYSTNAVVPVSLGGSISQIKSKTNDFPTIGGLRRLQSSLSKLPVVSNVGAKIRVALEQMLIDHPSMIPDALDHIGSEKPFRKPSMTPALPSWAP